MTLWHNIHSINKICFFYIDDNESNLVFVRLIMPGRSSINVYWAQATITTSFGHHSQWPEGVVIITDTDNIESKSFLPLLFVSCSHHT